MTEANAAHDTRGNIVACYPRIPANFMRVKLNFNQKKSQIKILK